MNLNKIVSYTLHPILFPIIGTLLYFILLPKHTSKQLEITIIGLVFTSTYIVPLLFLLTLKKSEVIKSYHLEEIQERKFPLMFFISIAFLLSTLIKKSQSTVELSLFFYGMTLAMSIAYLLLFLKFKASLHMVGIGGLIGFFIFFSYEFEVNLLILISILFIFAGIIAANRLKLKAHQLKEVYWGALIGVCSEIGVYLIYNM